jgi:hypothetical protein
MPLFFYLPMIVWMGMCGIAQDEMVPSKSKQNRTAFNG